MSASFRDIVLQKPGNRRDPRVKRPLNLLRMAIAALALNKLPQRLWNPRSGQQLAGGRVNLSWITKGMRKRQRDQQNHAANSGR